MEELKWFFIDDAVPPFHKGVLVTDGKVISFGKIVKIETYTVLDSANSRGARYTWETIEPRVQNPTHWMNLPKITK